MGGSTAFCFECQEPSPKMALLQETFFGHGQCFQGEHDSSDLQCCAILDVRVCVCVLYGYLPCLRLVKRELRSKTTSFSGSNLRLEVNSATRGNGSLKRHRALLKRVASAKDANTQWRMPDVQVPGFHFKQRLGASCWKTIYFCATACVPMKLFQSTTHVNNFLINKRCWYE